MVVPFFLPHAGCKDRCIYCHQGYITHIDESDLKSRIHQAFENRRSSCEPGLFGGNIFGLAPDVLKTIFSYFLPYHNFIEGFRISTKPVPLRDETIKILKDNNVRVIELGIPVFNDAILTAMNRGHTADDLFRAHERLMHEGFTVAFQFMVGLPGQSMEDILDITENMLRLKPVYIRIYPLVVLKNTPLYELYQMGDILLRPFDEVLDWACFIYRNAKKSGIDVVNVGLTDNELVREMVADGFYHPAYGFLVQSRLFYRAIEAGIRELGNPSDISVSIHKNDIPLFIGHKRENILTLSSQGFTVHWEPSGAERGKFEITGGGRRVTSSVI